MIGEALSFLSAPEPQRNLVSLLAKKVSFIIPLFVTEKGKGVKAQFLPMLFGKSKIPRQYQKYLEFLSKVTANPAVQGVSYTFVQSILTEAKASEKDLCDLIRRFDSHEEHRLEGDDLTDLFSFISQRSTLLLSNLDEKEVVAFTQCPFCEAAFAIQS